MSDPFENVLPTGADTILTISSLGDMLYQARSLNQTLEVIEEAVQQDRTINGTLVDLSVAQFHKYLSTITAPNNTDAPPLDGLWPGMVVTVQCIVTLAYLTAGGNGPANKPMVSGSDYVLGAYTFYRPELEMMIKKVELHFDEWKCVVGWTLILEEV